MDRQSWIKARNERWFPKYRPSHEVYFEFAKSLLKPNSALLHLGSGRDSLGIGRRLDSTCTKVVSLDLDWEGLSQNMNRQRVLATGGGMPFQEHSFDLIMADNVFEHLDDPGLVLCECHRVLKRDGALICLCPNRLSYIALAARLTPHWFHEKFKRACMSTREADTFPTYYRVNSPGEIRRIAEKTGFRVETLHSFVGWPTYWEWSDLFHRLFVMLHWLLEILPVWAHITLVGVLRPKASS